MEWTRGLRWAGQLEKKKLCFVKHTSWYNRVKKNQLDAQPILSIFRQPLHVSGVSKPIIRRYNRMYTTVGTYSKYQLLYWNRQPLHVSAVFRPIIRRYNRVYTTIGTYNKYQLLYTHGCTSWWWAWIRPKHVEVRRNILRISCASKLVFLYMIISCV